MIILSLKGMHIRRLNNLQYSRADGNPKHT
jgi:hypothetical protein